MYLLQDPGAHHNKQCPQAPCNHQILTDSQHGFRARRSCETQLLTLAEELISGLDKKQQHDLIILDFSKAIDRVPNLRLLKKTGTLWRSRFYPQLDKGIPDRQDTAGFGWRLHIWQYQSPQLSATRNSPRSSIILDIYQWPPGLCPIKYQAVCGWLHPVPMDKEPGRLSDTTRRP